MPSALAGPVIYTGIWAFANSKRPRPGQAAAASCTSAMRPVCRSAVFRCLEPHWRGKGPARRRTVRATRQFLICTEAAELKMAGFQSASMRFSTGRSHHLQVPRTLIGRHDADCAQIRRQVVAHHRFAVNELGAVCRRNGGSEHVNAYESVDAFHRIPS